jgi:hypothetical protein
MSDKDVWTVPVGLGEFLTTPKTLALEADPAVRSSIAGRFDLVALNSLSAKLTLTRWFDGGLIEGRWAANLTQTCGVSLQDFESDLKGQFQVRVVPEGSAHAPDPNIVEIALDLESDDPPDVIIGQTLDLVHYVLEDLSLSLDPFPRKPGAVFVAPAPAVEVSPFAILRQLKPKTS